MHLSLPSLPIDLLKGRRRRRRKRRRRRRRRWDCREGKDRGKGGREGI